MSSLFQRRSGIYKSALYRIIYDLVLVPNFIKAENPFPAPFPLVKYSTNTWLPWDLTSDGAEFPVIELNRLSLELPPL